MINLAIGTEVALVKSSRSFHGGASYRFGTVTKVSPTGQITVDYKTDAGATCGTMRFTKHGREVGSGDYYGWSLLTDVAAVRDTLKMNQAVQNANRAVAALVIEHRGDYRHGSETLQAKINALKEAIVKAEAAVAELAAIETK